MAKLSVFEPSSIEQSHRRRHPTKNVFSKNDSIFLLIVSEKNFSEPYQLILSQES